MSDAEPPIDPGVQISHVHPEVAELDCAVDPDALGRSEVAL